MNKPLFYFIACFIAPLALAAYLVSDDFVPSSTSNYGEFVEEEVRLTLPPQSLKLWGIMMLNQTECDARCEQRKNMLLNINAVLGKQSSAVSLLSSNDVAQRHSEFVALGNLPTLNEDALYLVDHAGLVVLKYSLSYQDDADMKVKKGLIKDLKKLLNYSRSRI